MSSGEDNETLTREGSARRRGAPKRDKRRVSEYLEPLKGPPKRKAFAVFDIESKDGDSQKPGFTRPFLVGVFDGLTYITFRDEPHLASRPWQDRHWSPGGCIDKTCQYLLSSRFNGYTFYSHNGGSFDELFLLRWLRAHEDEYGFEVVPVQSSIQKITVWKIPEDPSYPVEGHWEFLDSVKLLPMTLDKMLRTFKLPGKVKQDLSVHEDDPSWEEYLRWDCEGLFKGLVAVHDLIENKLGGEVGMTAPSTTMKLYRRRFLGQGDAPEKVPRHMHWSDCDDKENCDGCFHNWVRQAYYGGRTEPWRSYGEDLRYTDLNSSYVAAMRESMPAGKRLVERGKISWKRKKSHVGFAEATVRIPKTCPVPPLPWRSPSGKLVFPTGVFSGVWDVEELELVLDPFVGGEILEVGRVAWIERKFLFREMVEVLWRLRQKCLPGCDVKGCPGCNPEFDDGLSALAKLLGNAGYGKFGMDPERTQIILSEETTEGLCMLCGEESALPICGECDGSKPATMEPECDVWYQRKRTDAPYIIPQIAAHITTLARLRLFKYMRMVVELGGDISYLDTDSILSNVDLPTSNELGDMKDEYPGELLHGRFVQAKVYVIEKQKPFKGEHLESCTKAKEHLPTCKDDLCEGCACKGCRPNKTTMKGFPRKQRTKENLEALERGEGIAFERLEKVRTLARKGFYSPPNMVNVTKAFRGENDKRAAYACVTPSCDTPAARATDKRGTPVPCRRCGGRLARIPGGATRPLDVMAPRPWGDPDALIPLGEGGGLPPGEEGDGLQG